MPQTIDIAELFAQQGVPRVPQQARARMTRTTIFEAAAALFEEKGYSGTNTKEIADRAQIGVGTLYFHFSDKRQILLTMLHQQLSHYPQVGTVDRERLLHDPRAYIHGELRAAHPYNRVYYGISQAAGELFMQDQAFRDLTLKIIDMVCQQIRSIIEIGQSAGLTHPELDIEETARATGTLVYSFSNLMPSPSKVSEQEYWRRHHAAAEIVYRALFIDQPRPDPVHLLTH